jgi:UDP-N-acetylglucosamine 2-epimerase (non-hydrolysing)
MATSIATYYFGCKLCHVEAGLRTFNKKAPFPEEINRVLTSHIADIHFAPTETAKENLIKEGVPDNRIMVTGNTVIDALLESVDKVRMSTFASIETLKKLVSTDKDIILLTMHRRENQGSGVEKICKAILEISEKSDTQIVYPVHKNPNIYEPVHKYLGNKANIILIDPLSYEAFVWLMDKSKIIITDSGGIQEEAPSLGKPVLVLRNVTERPEAVIAGTVIMTGTDHDKLVYETLDLLSDDIRYNEMKKLHNPYGDGTAAKKIINYMINLINTN